MAEILLQERTMSVSPDDVPPIARGLVVVQDRPKWQKTLRETEWFTRSIKSTLYPQWETYENWREDELSENLYPYYRVICQNPRQAMVAEALKPRRAKVDIVMWDDFQRSIQEAEQAEADNKIHPLIKKLRDVNPRWWTALNLVSTGWGAISFAIGAAAETAGHTEAGPFLALGTALTVTSMILTATRPYHFTIIEQPTNPNRISKPSLN